MNFQLHLNTESASQCSPDEPLCLAGADTVREALLKMKACNQAAVLVCQDEALVGIFTERDALKLMAVGANCETPLSEVMTPSPAALTAHDTVGAAIRRMALDGYRRLPVVDDKRRPTGVIKIEGILHYLVEHFPAVIYNLPPEPHHATQAREGA